MTPCRTLRQGPPELSVIDMAALLGVSTRTVERELVRGMPSRRSGRHRYIDVTGELVKWLSQCGEPCYPRFARQRVDWLTGCQVLERTGGERGHWWEARLGAAVAVAQTERAINSALLREAVVRYKDDRR